MHILVHSQNRLFGECLATGLNGCSDVEQADFHWEPLELIAACAGAFRPGVLIDLQDLSCSDLAERLKVTAPQACILALAVDDSNPTKVVECAKQGFHALVPRDAPLQSVTRIIRDARRGEVTLAPKAVAGLMRALGEAPDVAASPSADPLTRREREVCLLVCDGLTNKEIALELNRSVGTVKNHIHSILSKLDVPRRGAIPRRVLPTTPPRVAMKSALHSMT